MRPKRAPRGFTLIEISIVLAVTAILTSVAFWRLAPSIERGRVNRSASLLAADLQWAQMRAATRRKPVVLIVSEPLKSYIIRDAATTEIFRERYMGDDTEFELDLLDANPTTVEIFPNGVTRNTATFTVEINSYQRNVRFTRAGQIRVTQ